MLTGSTRNNVLQYALDRGVDFAELFFEDKDDTTINFDGRVDSVASIHTYGVGLYLIKDLRSAYVYLNDLTEKSLMSAVDKGISLLGIKASVNSGAKGGFGTAPSFLNIEDPCPVIIYPGEVGHDGKIALLKEADLAGRSQSASVKGLKLTWFDRDQRIAVANTEGLYAEDRRVTCRMRFIPVVSTAMGSASTFSEYCAAAGVESFRNGKYLERLSHHISNLESSITAKEAPSAKVPVVLEAGGCSGTFFHEACGHQLEASGLEHGSLFWDKRGELIASPKVTLVDDGTMPGMYGSARIDDEGMPRQKNVLIEKGVLKGYMTDRLSAKQLGLERTGSGRRQDYAHATKPRMTNTYLAAGDDDDEAMITDLEEGLYVTEIGGGTGGREFTLLASTAYWVKNGRIMYRVKGASLLGRGDETMKKIDRVGRTFVKEEGGGSFCGADSGFIPTTTSGPRMRISEMVVGGKGEKS